MLPDSLGVVTAVRNRPSHLRQCAERISQSSRHDRHVIVDWSSDPPVDRQHLPADPRLSVVRVEGEQIWWLSRAYNQAIARCPTEWILHCDADCLLSPSFFDALQLRRNTFQLGSLPGGLESELHRERFGLLLAPRCSLVAVGGYEPLLVGWGFDDIDLMERLFQAGYSASALPAVGIDVIPHPDSQRCTDPKGGHPWVPPRVALEATHTANRELARWLRSQPRRMDLTDPGAACIGQLPRAVQELRQRALLAGALALLAGRHGRRLAANAPLSVVRSLVSWLALDPLAALAANQAGGHRGPAQSGPPG